MTEKYKTPTQWIWTLNLGFSLLLGVAFNAHAIEVSDDIHQLVEQEFPGATITEIRKDVWKGQPVTEVELIAQDGIEYEMIITESGTVLSIEEEKGLPWIGGELSLGLGVLVESDIYRGVGTEVQPAPFFSYENGPFEIMASDTITATYAFIRTAHFSVAAGGYLALDEGYDPDDSDFLEGMDDLDTLYGAGLHFEAIAAGWEAGLEVLQDLSGENDGQEVEISLAYPWHAAGFKLRPELSLTWLSEDTVDYFYGVSNKEARSNRPAYSPSSSYEVELELMVQRPIYGKFTAVGIVGVSTYGDEIKDSPLVDDDYGWEGFIGVMYTF